MNQSFSWELLWCSFLVPIMLMRVIKWLLGVLTL